ncbi:MAG: ribokinase [Gammaproteobacteria bacterium]|nr:ribokinase [Gammaproteobacteria bacterium]
MSVLVVGSFVTDLVATCDKMPENGETIKGNSFNIYPGGKGANQAVAACKMGSIVNMSGMVGLDEFGDNFIKIFNSLKMSTKHILRTKEAKTGTALIMTDKDSNNRIVVTLGANFYYKEEDLEKIDDLIKSSSIVLTQAEQSPIIVDKLALKCEKYNKKLIYNPAPARFISDETLKRLYMLTPNELELSTLVNRPLKTLDDYISASKELLSKGVKNIVVTLGERGSLYMNKDEIHLVKPYKVEALDTVGAGDSFNGALAALLDQGYEIKEALNIASAYSALEVTKRGAIPAMPKRDEVFDFIKNYK